MSNYQDSSSDPYQGAPPPAGGGYAGSGSPGAPPQTGQTQSMPAQGAPAYQDPSQFGAGHQQHQQQWSSGPGASRVEHHDSNKKSKVGLTSALKTTEFWVLVVVSLGLLLAALVTDQGDDGQGFGSQDAWRYVTILAAAYMISRGLTKFGGRDEDHDDHGHR